MTSSVSSATSAAASQATIRQTIAGNFDTFLQLLTTQLQEPEPARSARHQPVHPAAGAVLRGRAAAQDQRSPGDARGRLDEQPGGERGGYLGATITADGSTTTLADGKATWSLTAAKPAAKARSRSSIQRADRLHRRRGAIDGRHLQFHMGWANR